MSAAAAFRVARARTRAHAFARERRLLLVGTAAVVLALLAATLAGMALSLSAGAPLGSLLDTADPRTVLDYLAHPATRAAALEVSAYALLGCVTATALVAWRTRPERAAFGTARFATRAEAKRAGLLGGDGVVLGRAWGRYLTSPRGMSVALIASTGEEKDVSVLVPTLATYAGSAAVFDPKAELWGLTSGVRAAGGQRVFRFDPFSRETHRINVFDALPSAPAAERQTAIIALAASYYPANGDIWAPLARSYFFAVAGLIDETPDLHLSLGEVFRQGTGAAGDPREHFQSIIDARNTRTRIDGTDENGRPKRVRDDIDAASWDGVGDPPLSRPVLDALRAFANLKSDRMADSVVNTFAAPLAIWTSPIVDAATAASDVDLRDLALGRMSLYITVPTNRITAAAPVLGPLVTQILDTITDVHPDRDPRERSPIPTMLMLNELAQLRYQPQIELIASIIRGYDAFVVSVLQSLGQLRKPPSEGGYGVEGTRTFLDNHPIQAVFAPGTHEAARALADDIGEETITATTRSEGAGGPLNRRGRASESERGRALLLPQELRAAGRDMVFITARHVPLVIAEKVRYYATRDLVGRLVALAPGIAPRWPWLRPTHRAISAAVGRRALEAPVPTLDLAMHEARISRRIRRATDQADGERTITVEEIAAPLARVPVAENARPETIETTARAVLDVLEEGARALARAEAATMDDDDGEQDDG